MDISKDFTDSLKLLKSNWAIPLVIFVLNLFFIGLFFGLVLLLGINFVNMEMLLESIIALAIVILVAVLIGIYVGCACIVMASIAVKNMKYDFQIVVHETNKLVLRFLAMNIIIGLMFAIPVLVMILLVAGTFLANKIFGIFSVIAGIILIIIYIIYIAVRSIFSIPILFLEQQSAWKSVRKSFEITNNRFKDAGIVLLIIVAVSIVAGFGGGFIGGFENIGVFGAVFTIVALIIFYALSAIVSAFIYVFLIYSYIDFIKKDGRSKTGRLHKSTAR